MRFYSEALRLVFSMAAFSNQACSANAQSDGGPAPVETVVAPRDDCETLFGADRLSGASNSFGECLGACVSELRFDEQAGCRNLTLKITGWGPGGQKAAPLVFPTNLGVLTDKGVETGQQVAQALRGKKFLPVYGCPDCADGGRTELHTQTGAVESTLDYEFSRPPLELQKPDAFLQGLIDALSTCSNDELISVTAAECTPRP